MTSRISTSLLLLPLLSFLIYTQSSHLWRLIGRVEIDKPHVLQRWENSTALNSHDCRVTPRTAGIDACEDVKIHFASRTAFLACGDPVERTHWYPCAGMRDAAARSEASFREKLFKYDLATGETVELRIEGLQGDFITHGIDLFSLPGDSSKVRFSLLTYSLLWTTPSALYLLRRRGGNYDIQKTDILISPRMHCADPYLCGQPCPRRRLHCHLLPHARLRRGRAGQERQAPEHQDGERRRRNGAIVCNYLHRPTYVTGDFYRPTTPKACWLMQLWFDFPGSSS